MVTFNMALQSPAFDAALIGYMAALSAVVLMVLGQLWTRPDISDYVEASRFVLEDTASWFLGLLERASRLMRV